MRAQARVRYQSSSRERKLCAETDFIPKLTIEEFEDYLRIGIRHDTLHVEFDLSIDEERYDSMWQQFIYEAPMRMGLNIEAYRDKVDKDFDPTTVYDSLYAFNVAASPPNGRLRIFVAFYDENFHEIADYEILLCRSWTRQILCTISKALKLNCEYEYHEKLNLKTVLQCQIESRQGLDDQGERQISVCDSQHRFYSMMFAKKGIIKEHPMVDDKMQLLWCRSQKSASIDERSITTCELTAKIPQIEAQVIRLPELLD